MSWLIKWSYDINFIGFLSSQCLENVLASLLICSSNAVNRLHSYCCKINTINTTSHEYCKFHGTLTFLYMLSEPCTIIQICYLEVGWLHFMDGLSRITPLIMKGLLQLYLIFGKKRSTSLTWKLVYSPSFFSLFLSQHSVANLEGLLNWDSYIKTLFWETLVMPLSVLHKHPSLQ